MEQPLSPLRLLAKSYSNNLISRESYLEVREQLLEKLQRTGKLDDADLQTVNTSIDKDRSPRCRKTYTKMDRIVIGLGLAASAILAYILYY